MKTLDRVREIRERRMLSQEELAERAGVSVFTVQRIERGEGGVRPKTGRSIARALDVEVEDLLPKSQTPLFDDPTEVRRESKGEALAMLTGRLENLAERGEQLRVEILAASDGFPLWKAGRFAGAYAELGQLYEDLAGEGNSTGPARDAMWRLRRVASELSPLFDQGLHGPLDGELREFDAS